MADEKYNEDVEERKTENVATSDDPIKDAERGLRWKQDRRIIPLSAGIYFLCYLDRSNIGNAKILNASTHDDLMTEAHISNSQFTIALFVFLVAYGVFEVPSYGFYRTFWYKADERSIRVAFILAPATLVGAFGGAIAYGIGHINQAGGLSAWRWLFIIEGIPSLLSAFLVFFFLPDFPEDAKWLTIQERDLAVHRLRLEGSKGAHKAMTWSDAKQTVTDWRLWGHYVIYFGISVPFSSLSLVTPSITAGLGYGGLSAQLMTVPPYAVAYVMAFIGAIGSLVSAILPADAYLSRYGGLIIATSGAFACLQPLLGWLSSNIFSTASVGMAIALNIGLGGAPGQIVGVFIYKADEAKRGYPTAVGGVLLRIYYDWRNKKILRERVEGQEAS
ncbi:putative MFS transporter [Xylaria sp. FL0064]|nr:putative MFS transporter [Xylaria sp. FL0064]